MKNSITLDGLEYKLASPAAGKRAVVVVDRGWIFAGDVEEKDGKIVLRRAVWVFHWDEVGFDGVLANPQDKRVTIKQLPTAVEIPSGSEIFRCPVEDSWGL